MYPNLAQTASLATRAHANAFTSVAIDPFSIACNPNCLRDLSDESRSEDNDTVVQREKMPEKRSQQRLLDCDLVMIGWDGGSKKNNQLGNMTDISLNGIGVRVDHPLPPDTPVTICYESLSNGLILDIVRHHTPGTNEHFLGIEFVAASTISAVPFQAHL